MSGGDAIDQLVADFEARHVIWLNGFYLPIDLPATAPPEEVARAAMHGEPWTFLKSRKVQIRNGGSGKPI